MEQIEAYIDKKKVNEILEVKTDDNLSPVDNSLDARDISGGVIENINN